MVSLMYGLVMRLPCNARNTGKRLSVANEACPSAYACYNNVLKGVIVLHENINN
jgi:hypothetical protein